MADPALGTRRRLLAARGRVLGYGMTIVALLVAGVLAGCGIGGSQATPQELQQARYCQKYLQRCGDPSDTTCPDDPLADKYRCGE